MKLMQGGYDESGLSLNFIKSLIGLIEGVSWLSVEKPRAYCND